MRLYTLQLKRAVSAVLFVLLLSAVGMTKALAQSFTVGALNYSVNSDGVSVTVTGHVDGTAATGELVIPESVAQWGKSYAVTVIGNNAFYNCTGFTGNLVIPNSVTTISEGAFCVCSGFTGSLVIPNSVTMIGDNAFSGCTGFNGNLVIPNSVNTIGSYAFCGCSGFTGSLVIPNSVTTISEGAFCGCSGFTGNLVIPNSVTSIGSNAFWDCDGFTGNLTIGSSVTSIGSSAFLGCTGFTGSLVIPNSVTTISEGAFCGCSGFTGNLVIPNSVTSIGNQAFSWCIFSYVEYDATDCADALSSYPPFQSCSGQLIIGNNVERIPAYMFKWATFTKILSPAEMPPTVGADAFYGIDHDIPVYVPCGSLSNYQNARGWKEFNNIFECFEVKEITAAVTPANSGTVTGAGTYEIGSTCTLTAIANEGYTFIYWTENGVVVSTEAEYSFTVTVNRDLVANFVDGSLCSLTIEMYDSYGDGWNGNKLTVSDDLGGYNEITLDSGSSGNTTLLAPNGSHITLGWIMGDYTSECSFNIRYANGDLIYHGEDMSSDFSFEFDMVCVEMPATMFIINAIANPVEGGTVTGAGTYDYGTSVTIAATANVGYIFNNWAEEGEVVSTDESYTFIITDDHDFVANFTINTYNVTVAANPIDGGTVVGGGTYNHGVTATLTATANIGYNFVNWMENGEVVSTDAEYSFTVTCDRNLVANFSQNTYTISALAIPSNSGSVSGAGNYYYGDTCTLTATANTGYNFVHWTKNGTHVSTNATYSFTVTENASCVAYFRVTSYTISASANPTEGGTVSGGGTFNHGSTCTLTATANEDYTFVNWTENGTEVSTNAIYSFTVTGNRNLVANFTSDSGGYYWTVNVNQYPNTMTAIGVILIDDVEQMTNTLELGAFCGTECRGRERLAYISQIDRYLLFLTMYGENGDVLNFRLYDHALGQELDVICTNSVTFATNNTLGTVVSPYEFNFMEGIQTQTSSLPEGWSWWSTYIEQEGIDGLTQLENSLGENGVMIKSQSEGFTSRYGEYWFGLLNSINNESSYLVQTSGSCDVSLTGHVAVPSEHPITLLPGWTWIGYPNNTAMSVSTALSNLNPSENDMLKAQESFSVYYPGIGWFGSLQTIMPGMGLMYESHNTSSVTLTYSNPTRTDNLAENVTARTNHWNPDVYAYPNNMNVMAVVEVNGEELQSEDYELAAFANGECRGSAKLMYVEQLHRYMAFLTLHGDDETELSFGLYDNATGMTAYKSDARLIFTANDVAGSPDNPMVVSFSDMTGIDSFGSTLHVFPNPVERGSMITIGTVEESDEVRVEIMNAVGAVLFIETSTILPANIKAPEVPGVYMLRITSKGRGTRYVKLIVS